MKKSNKKRRVRFLTLWAALIVIAASVFTACPQKPKPKPTPKFKVNFSVEGANGTLKATADGIAETETSLISVEKGKTVTFTAAPNSGFVVDKRTVTGGTFETGTGTDENTTAKVKITADVTVKVSFKAKPLGTVAYKVEHYKQNVTGAEYTKAEEETKYGKPNEQTQAQAKVYEGFTAKPITQETIKADSSTVVKIEYDRKEITLTLNLDGGTTSTPLIDGNKLKGRFGSAVSVEDPTKPDHAFTGWNPPLPPTFPANDGTHTAQWAALHQITFGVTGANGTLSAEADGTAISSGNTVQEGKTVVFTATPDAQFAVEQWTVNGTPVPGNTANTYSHTVTAQADIGVSFKYAGPGLVLDTKDFTREQGKTIIYKLVTSGSGDYTATPENAAVISVTLNNATGNVTVRCLQAGSSRIRVRDNKSGEEKYSGTVTVNPLIVIPDEFTVDNIMYKVTDKPQRHVQINDKSGGSFTGTVHIAATVAFNGETYKITGCTDNCLQTSFWNVSAFTVEEASEFLSAENEVLFNKNKTRLIKYPKKKTDASYTVPDSVETIGKYAFYQIYDNLTALNLPEGKSLTTIEDYGIAYCTQLENINMPTTLTSLGELFLFSSKITEVVIPEGIERLEHASLAWCLNLTRVELPASFKGSDTILYRCTVLTEVVCKAVNPPALYNNSFGQGTPIGSVTLKVPAGSVKAYKAADVWKDFGTIEAIAP